MTYGELVSKAKKLRGKKLKTARGEEFTVRVDRDIIKFTPGSTGEERNDGRQAIVAFLDKWNITSSTDPNDYENFTRNAAYLLTLVGK